MRGISGIWRALDRARAMNLEAAGLPPAVPGDGGMTRRRAIAAMAGAAGLAACGDVVPLAQAAPGVVIVGGGLAGLSALDRLRKGNVAATLYEARGAVGGRTRSVRGVFAPVFAFDEGAQLVNDDHHDLKAMIGRFRLTTIDRTRYPGEELQIGRDGKAVSDEKIARALRGIAARISEDSRKVDEDAAYSAEIDRLSVKAYLDRHGLAPGDARDALEAGIRTEYGSEPEDVSALELLWNLPTVDGREVMRLSNSDERYLISGGTDQVAKALGAEHVRDIRLNKRLTAVEVEAGKVRLTFADGEQVSADHAILAMPPTLVREVRFTGDLPPLWRAFIAEANLGRNEKVIIGYDDSGWRPTIGFAGAVWGAGPFSAIWEAASIEPAPGPAALCYFLGGRQVEAARSVPSADLARDFSDIARRLLPGLPQPNGKIRRTRWAEDPLTKGAYSCFAPGQLTRFASLFAIEEEGVRKQVPQAGPLLFAGEHLSLEYTGFMNGALQSGRMAAEAILAPAGMRKAA
ncbi:MAG TPA: NAD(P)/FAD-dependent oxidoreductase [Allosphingosinicella sp.]